MMLTGAVTLLAKGGHLIIGVTTEEILSKKKNREYMQSFQQRAEMVRQFVQWLDESV